MASLRKHILPQLFLIGVCVVIFYHSNTQVKIEEEKQASAAMGRASSSSGICGEVKEVLGVKIERNPCQSKLDELGVTSWPSWTGDPSQIPWTFTAKETMYIVEGKVNIYCDGHDEFFEIGAGDLVEFPKGMKITWHVVEAVTKHYNLDK